MQVTGATVPTEPRFVSEAYFMDFKFEPGNYYLAGREQLKGKEVLRIEYYPTNLFNDDDDEKTPREVKKKPKEEEKERKAEEDINRKMNKTALVTLWVDPTEHQIVKYTFDNVWLDFLPAAWLVRIDDLRASMTMGQPFPGVWLPRAINIHAGLTLALGSFEARYDRAFTNYREGEVKTTIKVPKLISWIRPVDDADTSPPSDVTEPSGPGPFVPEEPEQSAETIREIRVHGNASLTDEEVLKLAGIGIGDAVSPESLKTIEDRLKGSDRFETVEVRKRYRSIDDPNDVALVLVVHERSGVRSAGPNGTGSVPGPWRRVTSRLMFFPIVSYSDGYGFTYGGRVSTVDLLGIGERLSVPLTWGGTKRAAIEFERTFKTGPVSRVFSTFGIWNRENPHFNIDDQRVELTARAERQFAQMIRIGVDATRSSVSFGSLDDRLWTFGTNAVLDTRRDPAFPGNAVLWAPDGRQLMSMDSSGSIATRPTRAATCGSLAKPSSPAARSTTTAMRPFRRTSVCSSAGHPICADSGPAPSTADRLLVTSAELRVPLTSVLHGAKLGLTVFMDASKAADFDGSFATPPGIAAPARGCS